MQQEIQIQVSPEAAADPMTLQLAAARKLGLPFESITGVEILRRSLDARQVNILVNLTLAVWTGEAPVKTMPATPVFPPLRENHQVIVVGAGPAGLFAALQLLMQGIKPVLLERGKNVKDRRRDLAAINRNQGVDPDSNYCFGEGGAGTYSDGKLYTRSDKRGDIRRVLDLLVAHGADPNILVEAHPHIGTNKLPGIIEAIRKTILDKGGEIHFRRRVCDFIFKEDQVEEVIAENLLDGSKESYRGRALILATGHSARNIYFLLHQKNVLLEAKPFAMGLRIEHPQELIDRIQYHCRTEEEREIKRKWLPAASYTLVEQVEGRGVYSFCMCPGGIIAPCATAQGEVVTNGWSPSKRNNPFANSGLVVSLQAEDWQQYQQHGPLAGLHYQMALEQMASVAGGGTQVAPAQRMTDFIQERISASIPAVSYQPGVVAAPLHSLLPAAIGKRLQTALLQFGKKMRGYLTEEAVLVGVESRTSTPVRIPRDKVLLSHPQYRNFYPCGEGAGYAGGIVSAAMDGLRVAAAIKI